MSDDALIEAMARAIYKTMHKSITSCPKNFEFTHADLAKAALAVARPIIEAPLRAENEKLREQKHDISVALKNIRAENEKLRAALDCFMGKETPTQWRYGRNHAEEMAKGILAAAAALKETGDE